MGHIIFLLSALRILAIGNSFSQDATNQYLYEIGKADGYDFTIGNMYIGGCPLDLHWRNAVSGENALLDEQWDVITIETYEPYLGNLLEYVRTRVPGAKIYFHQTWSYAPGSSHPAFGSYGHSSEQMYESICNCVRTSCQKHSLSVIPSGTAVQNARTALNGEDFTMDSYHMSRTLGRYLVACTWFEAITGKSVANNSYRPDYMDAGTAYLCRRSAHEAVCNPWSVTKSAKGMYWKKMLCDWDEPGPDRPHRWRGGNKKGYYSGALLGNGLLGSNIYKLKDNVYRINFSRSDITEQGPWFSLCHQARLPIGYFTLSTCTPVQTESMYLDTENAVTTARLKTTDGTIDFSAYIHALQDCLVFDSESSGSEKDYKWDFVPFQAVSPIIKDGQKGDAGYLNCEGKSNPDPERIDRGDEHYLVQLLTRDTSSTNVAKCYVVAWKEIARGPQRRIIATISFEDTRALAMDAACKQIRRCAAQSPAKMERTHTKWWHSFYDDAAHLTFPDRDVEYFHNFQYYKFASTARPGKPVVDLMGVWPTFDTPWPAIWVNLNLQLTYCWQTKANLGYLAQPLWDALWTNRANLTRNVTDVKGQEDWTDAACLPRASSYDFHSKLNPALAKVNAYEVGNLAWTLFYWYRQCLAYGDDKAMCERLFPLLKSSVNIFFHIRQVTPDGHYSLPPTASPEYGEGKFSVGPDSNYDLANLRQALNTLIELDERYALNDPDRAKWEDFLSKMPEFQYSEQTGFKVSSEMEFTETSHRHFSHLFMIYPYHMLDWNDPVARQRAEFSIGRWHGNTGYSLTGKAAMLASEGKGDEALTNVREFIKNWVQPNTLYAESGPVIETPFAAVSSLHELYMQDWGDRIRIFYGCPECWKDASFERMRAVGAFLIGADRRNGKTTRIRITSEKGGPCRIQSDIPADRMGIVDGKGREVSFDILPESVICFSTEPGRSYEILRR